MNMSILPLPVDRPAGEGARDILDVFLRVSSVDTQGVKLHQFATVILIDSFGSAFGFGLIRSGRLN
jgi:hypothetical protein